MKSQQLITQQLKKEKMQYDFILIDSSPGAGKNMINFLLVCDQIVVIVTSERLAVIDGYDLIKTLKMDYNVNVDFIVINMESKKDKARRRFNNIRKTCHDFLHYDLKYLGNIKYSDDMRRCAEDGELFMKRHKDHAMEKQIKLIGDILCQMEMTPSN
jgi:flagellar biosynthesis protein FlhG